jgi:hypothetical protein
MTTALCITLSLFSGLLLVACGLLLVIYRRFGRLLTLMAGLRAQAREDPYEEK